MFGPRPRGFWSGTAGGSAHSFLGAGRSYRVLKAFQDFDRHVHPADEAWVFLGSSFVPYEDGMSFFVSLDGEQEWQIRLQWRREEQAHVLDNLAEYVGPAR